MNRTCDSLLALCLFLPSLGTVHGRDQGADWIALFDGKSLDGWRANENVTSFRVQDGMIVADGPRSHLFFGAPKAPGRFRNFELKADVMTRRGANSGIHFHTQYQDSGWLKKGYEVQINNTHKGSGNYRELKKTGSLYAVRNAYKSTVKDDTWFSLRIVVRNHRIRVWVDHTMTVDYVEPEHPRRSPSWKGRVLASGTFALQCHDPGSRVFFRKIMARHLSDENQDPRNRAEAGSDTFEDNVYLHEQNFPLIDFHVHLKGGLTLPEALARSREVGIQYGIAANCGIGFPVTNDHDLEAYLDTLTGQPVFTGMQAEGREWVTLFSPRSIARFDYVFTDAMTFTNDQGKRMRLWIPEEAHVGDPESFMEMYVDRIVGILESEPIDIFVNPSYLPEIIREDYDALWTTKRMDRVIEAAVQNQVAIEINSRFKIPSATFIRRAKAAGATFSLGTNNGDRELGRLDYALQMVRECNLTGKDMFLPKPDGQKPVQVKGLPKR